MAERKIFAGGRVKRFRLKLGLSQTQMAAELGLSPSYLNLIERNQRPLTVQVLLKLSQVYAVDMAQFADGQAAGLTDALKEVFADPLLAGEIASPAELADLSETAPNAARGALRLHAAYREAQERLSHLSALLAGADGPGDGADRLTRLPAVGAADYFEEAGAWFAEIEATAEEIAARLQPRDHPAEALRAHLREHFGVEVRILPGHVMPVEQARYDRHSRRLFVSEQVPLLERPLLYARQLALLGCRDLVERMAARSGLTEAESLRMCRAGFAHRLAAAILAPAGRMTEAAREARLDILRLSGRFALRPLRVMARLAAIGAAGGELPPAFMVVLDASGGVLLRIPGAGFSFPRFGPLCSRLPLFDALTPGRLASAVLVLPDETSFTALALAEDGPWTPGLAPPRRLALIGWRRDEAARFTGEWPGPTRPVGVTCRLCERLDCAHRLAPPVTRPAAFHEHVAGPSDCELIG